MNTKKRENIAKAHKKFSSIICDLTTPSINHNTGKSDLRNNSFIFYKAGVCQRESVKTKKIQGKITLEKKKNRY